MFTIVGVGARLLDRLPPYGGQALIEGVMIRGVTCVSLALRLPSGGILVEVQPTGGTWTGELRRLPLARGLGALAEILVIGTRALLYSARVAAQEEAPAGRGLSSAGIAGSLGAGVLLAVGLFVVLPVLATLGLEQYLSSAALSSALEGLLRLAIFVAYLVAIGRLPGVRRVFAYHGAEHMAVHAQERGDPLTVAAARRYPVAHPRCGTAFVLLMLVGAIVLQPFLGALPLGERLLSRLLLLPLLASVSYEMLRWSGAPPATPLKGLVVAPGLLLQRLTTVLPDDAQLEVALRALAAAAEADASARPHPRQPASP